MNNDEFNPNTKELTVTITKPKLQTNIRALMTHLVQLKIQISDLEEEIKATEKLIEYFQCYDK